MINIIYRPLEYELLIEGHAGADEPGKDLVCCGVSALGYALESHLKRNPGFKEECIRVKKTGIFKAKAHPRMMEAIRCREAFDTIADGLKLMAETFPKYVKFEEKRGDD